MQDSILTLIPLLAPVLLLCYSLLAISGKGKVARAESFGLVGIVISGISAWVVLEFGTLQSPLLGWAGLGLAIRLDALSITMLSMISLLGFAILKFSANYLDGDARKGVFFSRLACTIASVELLVLSGNLLQILIFWIITSVCLHYLLVFYRSRPQAIAAARKKFMVARIGDLSLIGAITLIYQSIGTGDIDQLFIAVQNTKALDSYMLWASILLVIAAVLKSAQFPTHGWLIEVVETPTPVSALLHAGLLNAGPFLMVRFSHLMAESVSGSLMLIVIGGFTALFASVVYLTQPSVKVALGYSSVAHMGFSLLICGFGVYSAAILHVVAHSFYKAHSFLSSGSAVDVVRARKIKLTMKTPSFIRILVSVSTVLAIYILFCYLWGIEPSKDFSLMMTGAVIVMGLSQMMVTAWSTQGSRWSFLLSGTMAFVVALSFFTLESGARALLTSQLPQYQVPDVAIKLASVIVIVSYMIIVLIQVTAQGKKQSTLGYKLGVHLRNGLYVNVIFDRMIGSLKNEKFKWANLTVQEELDGKRDMEQTLIRKPEVVLNN